jgi:CheY-like chemotaxis protein
MSELRKKILIVDDEKELCKVISWDFEDAGFEVIQANGGIEAFKILQEDHFDIVLSDIKMPKGDGVELLRNISEQNISMKAFFLMTGYADYPEKTLKDLGMTKLFQKPIDTDDVIEFLQKEIIQK